MGVDVAKKSNKIRFFWRKMRELMKKLMENWDGLNASKLKSFGLFWETHFKLHLFWNVKNLFWHVPIAY